MNDKFKNRDFIEFVYENDENLDKCVIHVPEASKLSNDVKLRVAHGLFRMARRTITNLNCRIVVKHNWGFEFYDPNETIELTTEMFYNIITSHYKRTNAGGIYNVVFDGEPRVFKGPSYRVSVKDLDSVPEQVFREVSDRHEELLNIDNDAKFMEYLQELQDKQQAIEEATRKLQEEQEAEKKAVEKAIIELKRMQALRHELRCRKAKETQDKTIPESAYQPEMQAPSTVTSVPSEIDAQDLWNLLGCSYSLQQSTSSNPGPSAGSIRNQMKVVEQYIQSNAGYGAERDEQDSLFELDAALAGEGYEDARSDLDSCEEPEYNESNNWVSELIKVALDDYQDRQMTYTEAKEFLDAVSESNNLIGEEMDKIAKIEIEQAVAKLRYLHFGMIDPAMPKSIYDIDLPAYARNPYQHVEVEHDFDDGASVSTAIEPELEIEVMKEEPIIRNRKALYKKKRGEVMKKYKELERKQNKKLLHRLRRHASIRNCPCNNKEKPTMIENGTCPEGEIYKNDQYREVHLNEDYRYIPERTELCLKEESDMEYSGLWCSHIKYPVYKKVLRLAIWDYQAGKIVDPALVILKSHNVKAIIPHTPDMSINRANFNGVFDLNLSFLVPSESVDASAVIQIVDLGYGEPRPISNYLYIWHCGPVTKQVANIMQKNTENSTDWWLRGAPSARCHVDCGKDSAHDLPVQETFTRLWNDKQPAFIRNPCYSGEDYDLNDVNAVTTNDHDDLHSDSEDDYSTTETMQKPIRCCECKGPCLCQSKMVVENGNDAEYPFDEVRLYSFREAYGERNTEIVNLMESDLEPIGMWCPHLSLPVYRKLVTVSFIAESEFNVRRWNLMIVRHNNIQAVVPGKATVTPEYIMDFTTEKCYDIELMVVVQDPTKDAYAVCQIVDVDGFAYQNLSGYMYIWFDAKNRKQRLEYMGYEPHPIPSTYYINDCSSHAAHPYPKMEKLQPFFPDDDWNPCFEHPESDKDESETEKTSRVEEDNESTVTAIEPEDQELDEFERVEAAIVPYSDSDYSDDEEVWDGRKIVTKIIDEDQESVATAIEQQNALEDESTAWDYSYDDDRESYKTAAEEDPSSEVNRCTLCEVNFNDFDDFMAHMIGHLCIETGNRIETLITEDSKEKETEIQNNKEDDDEYAFVTEKDVAPSTSGSSEGTSVTADFAINSSDGSDFEIINESDEDY